MRFAVVVAAAFLAAGCACAPVTPALFVVVPAPDGHVGKIVVRHRGDSRVVDSAYGGQRLGTDGRIHAAKLSPGEVREMFGPALDALPPIATSFTLYFLEGLDELTPESKEALDRVLEDLRRRPLPDVMVIGHTDTVGGLEYNDRLSRARAERLREILVSLGLPPERIQVAGRGEREPLVATPDNVSEPRNRRVEISVR